MDKQQSPNRLETFKPVLEIHTHRKCLNNTNPLIHFVKFMGNHRDNLLWPRIFTTSNCILCYNNDKGTWPYLINIIHFQVATTYQIGPQIPTPDLSIEIIEFTYTHDR